MKPDHVRRLFRELAVMCVFADWSRMRDEYEFGSRAFTECTVQMCQLLTYHVPLFKVYYKDK